MRQIKSSVVLQKASAFPVDSSSSTLSESSSFNYTQQQQQQSRQRTGFLRQKGTKLVDTNSSTAEIPQKMPMKSVVAAAAVASTAVAYACPYCPRELRNSSLLSAHIANYHHKKASSSSSSRSTKPSTTTVSQKSFPSWKSSQPAVAAAAGSAANNYSRPLSKRKQSAPKFTCLLTCYRCNTRTTTCVSDEVVPAGLVQCGYCLRWQHCRCYGLPFEMNSLAVKTLKFPFSFVCDCCRMVLRPVRRSRQNEWHSSRSSGLLQSPPNGCSEYTQRSLFAQVTAVLNKTCQLRPLIQSGQYILNKSSSSLPRWTYQAKQDKEEKEEEDSGTTRYKTVRQEDASSSSSKLREVETSKLCATTTTTTITTTKQHTAFDSHTPEDQVNRLYMELRGIAFGEICESSGSSSSAGSGENALANIMDISHVVPIDNNNNNNPNPTTTFPITPESEECCECPNTSWVLDTSVQMEPLPVDDSMVEGSHDLSGLLLLQDLGADIIPEISSLNVVVGGDGGGGGGVVVTSDQSTLNSSCCGDHHLVEQSRQLPPSSASLCGDSASMQLLLPSLPASPDKHASQSSTTDPKEQILNHHHQNEEILAIESKRSTSTPSTTPTKLLMSQLNSAVGADIMNLPIPSCARSIISDLLKSPLSDDFIASACGVRQSSPEPKAAAATDSSRSGGGGILNVSCASNELSHVSSTSVMLNPLEIDWLETATTKKEHPLNPSNSSTDQNPVLNDFPDISNHHPIPNDDNDDDTGSDTSLASTSSPLLSEEEEQQQQQQHEKLSQAQNNLMHLDEKILSPFEKALDSMEAYLDAITMRVNSFEQLLLKKNINRYNQNTMMNNSHSMGYNNKTYKVAQRRRKLPGENSSNVVHPRGDFKRPPPPPHYHQMLSSRGGGGGGRSRSRRKYSSSSSPSMIIPYRGQYQTLRDNVRYSENYVNSTHSAAAAPTTTTTTQRIHYYAQNTAVAAAPPTASQQQQQQLCVNPTFKCSSTPLSRTSSPSSSSADKPVIRLLNNVHL
ncbi:unnamed protein product [Trichobilharzia szidati]|nr:unnamed protein product [Trichobilharzia szidati]